MNEIETQT